MWYAFPDTAGGLSCLMETSLGRSWCLTFVSVPPIDTASQELSLSILRSSCWGTLQILSFPLQLQPMCVGVKFST